MLHSHVAAQIWQLVSHFENCWSFALHCIMCINLIYRISSEASDTGLMMNCLPWGSLFPTVTLVYPMLDTGQVLLANSEDPDEMQQKKAFYHGLHRLLLVR